MNISSRTEKLYKAMSDIIDFLDPTNAVHIVLQDAYGAQLKFDIDQTTDSKLKIMVENLGFIFTESEESVIYEKSIDAYGYIIVSKAKNRETINLTVTI